MLRIAGASAVVRTKVTGANPAPGVTDRPTLSVDVGLPEDAHATSAQANRSGGSRMPQYTPPTRMGSQTAAHSSYLAGPPSGGRGDHCTQRPFGSGFGLSATIRWSRLAIRMAESW